jgi:hypothetical protein
MQVQHLLDAVRQAATVVNLSICAGLGEMSMSAASHLYEVLYVGKVVVSTKKAPPTFIDDAVSKFEELSCPKVG